MSFGNLISNEMYKAIVGRKPSEPDMDWVDEYMEAIYKLDKRQDGDKILIKFSSVQNHDLIKSRVKKNDRVFMFGIYILIHGVTADLPIVNGTVQTPDIHKGKFDVTNLFVLKQSAIEMTVFIPENRYTFNLRAGELYKG